MKVVINFGEVQIVVPCGDGEILVRELIDKAVPRYKKALDWPLGLQIIVLNLKTDNNAILGMSDILKDVVNDKEHLVANFMIKSDLLCHNQNGDGTSDSSNGISGPDLILYATKFHTTSNPDLNFKDISDGNILEDSFDSDTEILVTADDIITKSNNLIIRRCIDQSSSLVIKHEKTFSLPNYDLDDPEKQCLTRSSTYNIIHQHSLNTLNSNQHKPLNKFQYKNYHLTESQVLKNTHHQYQCIPNQQLLPISQKLCLNKSNLDNIKNCYPQINYINKLNDDNYTRSYCYRCTKNLDHGNFLPKKIKSHLNSNNNRSVVDNNDLINNCNSNNYRSKNNDGGGDSKSYLFCGISQTSNAIGNSQQCISSMNLLNNNHISLKYNKCKLNIDSQSHSNSFAVPADHSEDYLHTIVSNFNEFLSDDAVKFIKPNINNTFKDDEYQDKIISTKDVLGFTSNKINKDTQKILINLVKGPKGLGFSVTSQDNKTANHNSYIFVKKIMLSGSAFEDGRLLAGDCILKLLNNSERHKSILKSDNASVKTNNPLYVKVESYEFPVGSLDDNFKTSSIIFSREGYGRQSISEKRKGHVDPKFTETYNNIQRHKLGNKNNIRHIYVSHVHDRVDNQDFNYSTDMMQNFRARGINDSFRAAIDKCLDDDNISSTISSNNFCKSISYISSFDDGNENGMDYLKNYYCDL